MVTCCSRKSIIYLGFLLESLSTLLYWRATGSYCCSEYFLLNILILFSAYILKCGVARFYRLWYRYYEQYQSITRIFRVLYRNGIFVKINYVTFYKTHQGFPLKGKVFFYKRRCKLKIWFSIDFITMFFFCSFVSPNFF